MASKRRFLVAFIASLFLVSPAAVGTTVAAEIPHTPFAASGVSIDVSNPTMGVAPNGEIWIADRTTNANVTVVDAEAQTVLASIDVGASAPLNVVFSRDGKFAYVLVSTFEVNSYWSGIVKIDTKTHAIVSRWKGPHGINSGVISKDGKVLYLHSQAEGSIALFSTKDGTRLRTLGDTVVDWTVTLNAARTKGYSLSNGTLYGIDMRQMDRIFRSAFIGQFSCGLLLGPGETTIWTVTDCYSPNRSISIYSTKSFKLLDQIPHEVTGYLNDIKFSKDNKKFYLLKSGEISIFAMKKHKFVKSISIPDGSVVWELLNSKTALVFSIESGNFEFIDVR